MSGHSKWASIKHKKGALDAKRGKIFTKIIKEITVAARLGGGDQEANPRLRAAILKAKAENMPKENIDRAVKKGTGDLEGVNYTEITYEAYGPGGAAILINTLTDNRNRTAADVRNMLTKGNGNLGETGCVSYLFKRKGVMYFDGEKYSEDDVFAAALDAGADDVTNEDGTIEVITEPESFESILEAMNKAGFEESSAEISMLPDTRITLEAETTRKVLRLLEKLEDHEDVQYVASNIDIPDDFDFDEE
ncbi:MAG: YebC/PmpR family DNA-binding transcriptional regulator [Spirochaetales bacterium]|nr:MAG: YebC/PmpR family DNA-binding transcriptional regulator [Spirochaetales bacterium]